MIGKTSKIFVAGHKGLVGSAILRLLKLKGYKNIITANRKNLDLLDQKKVFNFLKQKKPDFIFLAAAKVGGIHSNNKYKANFIYENLMIQSNIIHSAYMNGIKELIFLGSSCVYPKFSKQPMKEKYLLSGELEKTNDAYAIAKIAGIKMCESYNEQYKTNYKCLMPTNTFGPNDNYDKLNSHFISALIRKIYEIEKFNKKKLVLWGNGKTKREVIFVDDIADACVYFMNKKTKHHLINIGTGKDHSILKFAKICLNAFIPKKNIKITFIKKNLNGTPRKVLDVSLANKYGWRSKTKLIEALKQTYKNLNKNDLK